MPSKRMRVVEVESASYDEIKDAVVAPEPPAAEVNEQPPAAEAAKPVEEKPVEEKPVEEKPVEEKHVEEKPVEEKPVEEFKEVKPKKEAPRATCEWCSRNMTAKNLKYSHRAICPKRPRDEETPAVLEPVVEEPPAVTPPAKAPPMPKLKRAVTVTNEVSEQEPPSEAKPKSKPRAKAKAKANKIPQPQSEPTTPVRRSKAVVKAELYEKMVANALP